MPTTIVMPQLGESVAEGVIGKWLKNEGEQIGKDEPIVEVITDKVNAEIPSPVAGVLQKISQPEGATVAVGQEIAIIGDEGGAEAKAPPEPARAGAGGGDGRQAAAEPRQAPSAKAAAEAADVTTPTTGTVGSIAAAPKATDRADRVRSSPLVRRLAEQYGVNLTQVPGTGIGGRVNKQDILSFIEQKEKAPAATAVAVPPGAAPQPRAARQPGPNEEIVPLSPVRKMIADRMAQSMFTIPHASTISEVDMTNVVRFREARKDEFRKREGAPLSYVAFVIQAAAEALKEYPDVNAEFGGDHIIRKHEVNINVAADAPEGLTTPVIRHADEMSIAGLSKAIYDLAMRARNRKLKIEDVQGGSFTINNTGALGSVEGVSIINYPQVAILSPATIVKRPVVVEQDGQDLFAVRHMMNLCLSFDHRAMDGGYAAGFLNAVKNNLQSWTMDHPLY